jgi:hypothetical protein
MPYYKINSTFGEFSAVGNVQLARRIHEINVIKELRAIDKSKLTASSAGDALKKPIEGVVQIVGNPVETLKGVPKGVGRWFKRTKRRVEDTAEAINEYSQSKSSGSGNGSSKSSKDTMRRVSAAGKRYLKRFFGVTKAYRALAREYKVDPYTNNSLLKTELETLSKYSAAGSFGTRQFDIGLPSGLGDLSKVGDLVWDSDPLDLLIRNEEESRKLGISKQAFERFFDNPHLSPTDVTLVVEAIRGLKGVNHRSILFDYVSESQSKDEAHFVVRILEFYKRYHQNVKPLQEIMLTERLPLAVDHNDRAVVFVPVYFLRWTNLVGAASVDMMIASRQSTRGGNPSLWVEGKISPVASQELINAGWELQKNILRDLLEDQ